MMTATLVLFAAALLIHVVASCVRMERILDPVCAGSGARRVQLPSVTVIRPIKGLDVGCRENTEALLAQGPRCSASHGA